MSTIVSQILTDAYRELNLTSLAGSITSNEQAEALRLLNRLIPDMMGFDFGDPYLNIAIGKGANIKTVNYIPLFLDDIPYDYVPSNTRLHCNMVIAESINLDPVPRDGARISIVDNLGNLGTYNLTVCGNGRQIESAGQTQITLNTNGLQKQWFYRDDLGMWVKTSDLATSDYSPYPEEFDDLLAIQLAMRLSPRNGPGLTPESQMKLKDLLNKFKARYRQTTTVPAEQGIVRLPSNFRARGDYNAQSFEKGFVIW